MTNSYFKSLLACLILCSCTRPALDKNINAMRPVAAPVISDDFEISSLIQALKAQSAALKKSEKQMVFGPRTISSGAYALALDRALAEWEVSHDQLKFLRHIQDNFEFLEVYGRDSWGDTLFTSYYAPLLNGSSRASQTYSQPLYKKPSDLLALDLLQFDPKYENERKLRARLADNKILPYYTREDIDIRKVLTGRGLEICWVDPIDAFFLHIQGSGTVKLESGKELEINYAEKNGAAYKALGNFLKDKIPLEEMSADRIEEFLRTLSRDELYEYLKLNPSYVFFQASEKKSTTSSGLSATAGRTIASDKRFFPSGALAYIEFDLPAGLNDNNHNKIQRLVLDQDSGGAILGGGRVDLFWGRGNEAKFAAGKIKQNGKIYYLFPKNY